MAGMSQKTTPDDVLSTLARGIHTLGYQQNHATEYLLLLQRYVRQARDLQSLTAQDEIRVEHCKDADHLLQVLGYRLSAPCGQKDLSLVTSDPERAFLTTDSGFPLTRLEHALATDAPFSYPYAPSPVPILFNQSDWSNISAWTRGRKQDLLDVLLHDRQVAILYRAMSKLDPETATALQRSAGLPRLLPYAAVLDFYGTQIAVRSHRVLVPGGKQAESAWEELVGASPESPGDFVLALVSKDKGWLAVYYDSMARVDQVQQAHLTQGARLRRLYDAFQESNPDDQAAGAAFRKAPALLILFTRQRWLPDGQPRIPGNLTLWKAILNQKSDFKTVHAWAKKARSWNHSEQVLDPMVAFSRLATDSSPLQIYLTLAELESDRPSQRDLSPQTMLLMASAYTRYSSWYPVFSEFPELGDSSIAHFINTAESLDRISNVDLRGNALGIFQANLGLWQITARQGEIPRSEINSSWQEAIEPFQKIGTSAQLLDAGFNSLGKVMMAASGSANRSQDELMDILAGPAQKGAQAEKVRAELSARIRAVEEDQRLVSLDTLSELDSGLKAAVHGAPIDKRVLALAAELKEFEMPRPIFTESEKGKWAPGVYSDRRAESQVRIDLAKTIEHSGSPEKLEAARGQLASFMRDTLVGLNYAYYEPPGSKILHINPLFVRSHDFSGSTVVGEDNVWQEPTLFGAGEPAGGGAYLVGSLADLPYVLAESEQDFISPENVQALIWQELAPDLLASSTMSRWWNVSAHELHAVALYQMSGEEILTASVDHPELQEKVISIFSDRMSPRRLGEVKDAMQTKDVKGEFNRLTPADTFYLAAEFRHRYPQEASAIGPMGHELDRLARDHPAEVGLERISRDFGIPHPVLEQSYGRELLNVQLFPAFSGYCSRLLGESWDSNNLYWARLADEKGQPPVALNLLAPQLTQMMVAKIFASNTEDWPAVLNAMHETGADFLQGKAVPLQPETETTAER
jgi:hypothetical protein